VDWLLISGNNIYVNARHIPALAYTGIFLLPKTGATEKIALTRAKISKNRAI
jgi:hypothetical protein